MPYFEWCALQATEFGLNVAKGALVSFLKQKKKVFKNTLMTFYCVLMY